MQKQVTKSIIVKGNPSRAFEVWTNFEDFPKFMKYIKSVTRTGANTSRWVVELPGAGQLEWEAETTMLEPGTRIGWNSKDRGDFTTSGQTTFTALPEKDQTQVTVTFQFSADIDEMLSGETLITFEQILEEDLRNYKAYVEGMHARLPKEQ
jgi:uncharacterized membrane protein